MQINDTAADELPKYLELGRPDLVICFNPTETISAEEAVRMTDGGKRLVVVA